MKKLINRSKINTYFVVVAGSIVTLANIYVSFAINKEKESIIESPKVLNEKTIKNNKRKEIK